VVRGWYRISPEVGRRIVLRRVARGGVALILPGLFTDRGRPMPDYVYPFLCDLCYDGRVRFGAARLDGGNPVELTPSGEALLAALGGPGSCAPDTP